MIDPRDFVKNAKPSKKLKDISGSFACPEQDCYELTTEGKYDPEEKKVYWVCSNGHEGAARLMYE